MCTQTYFSRFPECIGSIFQRCECVNWSCTFMHAYSMRLWFCLQICKVDNFSSFLNLGWSTGWWRISNECSVSNTDALFNRNHFSSPAENEFIYICMVNTREKTSVQKSNWSLLCFSTFVKLQRILECSFTSSIFRMLELPEIIRMFAIEENIFIPIENPMPDDLIWRWTRPNG